MYFKWVEVGKHLRNKHEPCLKPCLLLERDEGQERQVIDSVRFLHVSLIRMTETSGLKHTLLFMSILSGSGRIYSSLHCLNDCNHTIEFPPLHGKGDLSLYNPITPYSRQQLNTPLLHHARHRHPWRRPHQTYVPPAFPSSPYPLLRHTSPSTSILPPITPKTHPRLKSSKLTPTSTDIPLTPLSILSPYSALILSIVLVILFLIKQYIFDAFLLHRLYGDKYSKLGDVERRGFVNHHIAGGMKLLILIVGVYPFIDVAFRYLFPPLLPILFPNPRLTYIPIIGTQNSTLPTRLTPTSHLVISSSSVCKC